MSHKPEDAIYLGPDEAGNLRFAVESATTEGLWYTTVIFPDGIGGICDCKGYQTHGHCGMTDGASRLKALAERVTLVKELLDLSAGITYNLQEDHEYRLDAATELRVFKLEALADRLLCH